MVNISKNVINITIFLENQDILDNISSNLDPFCPVAKNIHHCCCGVVSVYLHNWIFLKLNNLKCFENIGRQYSEDNRLVPSFKTGKADFLKAVVALPMSIPYSCIDAKGNSLYHYASQTSKEIIEVCTPLPT